MSTNPGNRRPGANQVAIPPLGVKAPLSNPGLKLPPERDESTGVTADLVDTDMHATHGQGAKRRECLVPGPGGKPPPSGG